MKKINNNLIVFSLKMLTIFAFGLMFLPSMASATPGYVDNPVPSIDSISPNSGNLGSGQTAVTLTGGGFIPGSIARVNGVNRSTTFVDYAHVVVHLTRSDMSLTDGFIINVFNGFPGGGYSNGVSFTTISNAPAPTTNTNTNNTNTNTTNTTQNTNTTTSDTSNTSNLASNAIFGSGGFLPSGLIQWVLFAIVILLIVILVRKIFGGREKYDETPMKHA